MSLMHGSGLFSLLSHEVIIGSNSVMFSKLQLLHGWGQFEVTLDKTLTWGVHMVQLIYWKVCIMSILLKSVEYLKKKKHKQTILPRLGGFFSESHIFKIVPFWQWAFPTWIIHKVCTAHGTPVCLNVLSRKKQKIFTILIQSVYIIFFS